MRKFRQFSLFIILILLSLIPLTWFLGRSGMLINGVDTNFPLNPEVWFFRRFYVWNSINNAGADFSASTAGLFFHLIQFIPYKIGFNLQLVEIISLVFWFSVIIFNSYFFIRSLIMDRWIQLLFVIFYSFNTYIFNTWENVKVANLSLMAAIPLGLLVVRNYSIRDYQFFLITVITSVLLSGSGINPAYFFAFFMIIAVSFISDIVITPRTYKEVSIKYLLFIFLVLLLNLYWILPSSRFILTSIPSTGSIYSLGFTNWLDSLSQNTSIINVLKIQGAWDWYARDDKSGLPLYIPYALNYFERLPFILFSFVFAVLSLISLIYRTKKLSELYILGSLLIILGVFFGVGSHSPTGEIYKFLSIHLPFFSLFRSPWYIFTPLLILGYSLLISLLFLRIIEVSDKLPYKKNLIKLAIFLLIMGNLIYCYPLLTGKIFRIGQPDSFFVKFPGYVFDTASSLDIKSGRVISYPPDEIEQFNWRYRGIESILQLFSQSELIYSSLNSSDSMTSGLIKDFYLSLSKDQIDSAARIANLLNISTIFVKEDQPSLALQLSSKIKTNLYQEFGPWKFYRLFTTQEQSKFKTSNSLVSAYPFNIDSVWVSGIINSENIFINPDDIVLKQIDKNSINQNQIIIAKNDQLTKFSNSLKSTNSFSEKYMSNDFSRVNYDFNIKEDGAYGITLEKFKIESFGLTESEEWPVYLDNNLATLQIDKTDDSYIYFKPIVFSKGDHQVSFNLNNENQVDSNFMMNDSTKNIDYIDNSVVLTNSGQSDVMYELAVHNFDPRMTYLIEASYKHIQGADPYIVAFQTSEQSPIKKEVEKLALSPERKTFHFYFEPVKTKSDLVIQLIAAPVPNLVKEPFGSKTVYDSVLVHQVFTNQLALTKIKKSLNNTSVKYKMVSPIKYQGEVTGGEQPHVLVFSENFSPFWQVKLFTTEGKVIKYQPGHFTANFYANGWLMQDMPDRYKFEVFYTSQSYFWFGALISCLTGLSVIIFATYGYVKKNKTTNS